MADAASTTADLPHLVLLGKVGAGKSWLLRALTGQGDVGEGFAPTTQAAHSVDLPAHAPVLRLTDLPGLSAGGPLPLPIPGAVWVAMARLDDPVQAPLAAAIQALRRADRGARILVVLTGAERVADAGAQARAGAAIRAGLDRAAGGPLPWVQVARDGAGDLANRDALVAALTDLMPAAQALAETEAQAFTRARALILRHAAGAGAADVLPLVGALGVPAAQGLMLAGLARGLGVAWTPARATAFAGALGAGLIVQQGAGLALRQGAKLVPVVGQTLGAAAAGAASAAATYALGRAAHAWLWGQARGQVPAAADLRAIYARALSDGARDARR